VVVEYRIWLTPSIPVFYSYYNAVHLHPLQSALRLFEALERNYLDRYPMNLLECRRETPAGTARAEDPATRGSSEAAVAVPAESERRNGKQ